MPSSPLKLDVQESYAIKHMRDGGALTDLNPDKFPRGGWAKVCCPDGDCTPEHLAFYNSFAKRTNDAPVCVHLCPVRGGPGAIPPSSPITRIQLDPETSTTAARWVGVQLEDALKIKGPERVRHVCLVAHCPCGMMRANRVSLWQNLHLSFLARRYLREHYPNTFGKISVLLHAQQDGMLGAFRTYHVVEEVFEHFYRRHRKAA